MEIFIYYNKRHDEIWLGRKHHSNAMWKGLYLLINKDEDSGYFNILYIFPDGLENKDFVEIGSYEDVRYE
jgi:hypothetical protein